MTIRPKYTDSVDGALTYLQKSSRLDLTSATAEAEHGSQGVWKVWTPEEKEIEYILVTLKGYPNILGEARRYDDHEIFYRGDNL